MEGGKENKGHIQLYCGCGYTVGMINTTLNMTVEIIVTTPQYNVARL